MKNFKKIMAVALIALLAVAAIACTKDGGDENKGGATVTAAPTPYVRSVKLTPQQLNNYIVKYDVKKESTELVQDETGAYVPLDPTVDSITEVGYSAMILRSTDNGTSFNLDPAGVSCFAITNTADDRSFFTAHFNYDEAQLVDKGTETVAGIECKHYYFKSGLIEIDMYVDLTTDMCLKYENKMTKTSIEVTSIEFEKVDTAGYEWANYIALIPTPEPVTA